MNARSPSSRRSFLGASTAALIAPLLTRRAAAAVATGSTPQAVGDDTSRLGRTPHTKFAVNIEAWFPKVPFLERFDRAAQLGYSAVEIWPWRGRDLDAIKKKCDALGLTITQFTAWGFEPGMNDPRNHEKALAEIEESCKVANQLGVKQMCVVAGNDQPGMTQEQMHQNVIDCLKRAAPIAEKHQVVLMLESMNIRVDHKGHCLYGSAPALKIARAVNSPSVKLMWDIYHMHISEGDNCGHIKEGFDQIAYFQLADHPGRHEPGTGEMRYNRILQQIHDLGYRGYIGLECWPSVDEVTAARAIAAADVF